jgi:prevent-host-death family protein
MPPGVPGPTTRRLRSNLRLDSIVVLTAHRCERLHRRHGRHRLIAAWRWCTLTPGATHHSIRKDFRPENATIRAMKQVSIQDLKARLSAMVAEAESGDTIIITRHNTPVAQLSPARTASVHCGKNVGSGRIRAAVKRGTNGRYLEVLLEDRGNR